MGHLRRLLLAATPRCAHSWSEDVRAVAFWHTCTLEPGHAGGHTCTPAPECGATLSQAA
jgi:hypothetical protein